MTSRTRRKPLLVMPPLACQIAGCAAEYAAIGDYEDTRRAAELGGWRYCIFDDNGERLIGAWVCPDHRHVLPWWPGRRLALPQREPGATRAEFLGVVPRDVSWSTAALPAPEPDLEPLPESDALDDATRKLAALHDRYVAGEDVSAEVDQIARDYHRVEPQPDAEQPAGSCPKCGRAVFADNRHEANDRMTCPQDEPHPWQAAMDAQLSPEALAGGVPLESLAPEPDEEEQDAAEAST